MDLLAKKRVLLVLMVVLISLDVWAEDGFYRLTRVDFFSLHATRKKEDISASLWEDQPRMPEAVRNLLDNPNDVTARRYIDWNRARLAHIVRAQSVVDAVMEMERKP